MALLTRPAPRWGHCAAELPTSNEIVIFGGKTTSSFYTSGSNATVSQGGILNDTITWNGTAFTFVNTTAATTPPARFDAMASFDGSFVSMIGGSGTANTNLSDHWCFNGVSWFQQPFVNTISGTGTYAQPATIRAATMAYNAISPTGPMLYGGNTSYNRMYSVDEWIFSSAGSSSTTAGTWTRENLTSFPPSREYACTASNGNGTTVLCFGKNFNGPLGDVWQLTNVSNTWTQITANTSGVAFVPGVNSPLPRYGASFAYNASAGNFVLFGGCTPGGYFANDTWTYTLSTQQWAQQTVGTAPAGRAFASATYLTANTTVMMFGGLGYDRCFNDCQVWNNSVWTVQ
jgi:hypothetical protein